jgi:hypothetical protein
VPKHLPPGAAPSLPDERAWFERERWELQLHDCLRAAEKHKLDGKSLFEQQDFQVGVRMDVFQQDRRAFMHCTHALVYHTGQSFALRRRLSLGPGQSARHTLSTAPVVNLATALAKSGREPSEDKRLRLLVVESELERPLSESRSGPCSGKEGM